MSGGTPTPPRFGDYVPAIYGAPDLEFWAVAKNAPSSTPCYLYRSRDYGQTWQSVPGVGSDRPGLPAGDEALRAYL